MMQLTLIGIANFKFLTSLLQSLTLIGIANFKFLTTLLQSLTNSW